MVLAVDVGGTFTDLVWWDGSELRTAKVPTNVSDQSKGVMDGAAALLGKGHTDLLLHGTTSATNALLERRGARVALVVDAGFEDMIEIGRQDRPSLYDSFADRVAPLVTRSMRFGLGREEDAGSVARRVGAAGPEAVAVSLLWADDRAIREAAVAEAIIESQADIPISLSHVVLDEVREFERSSTTVVNAYLQPVMRTYLENLRQRASAMADTVAVMSSAGGLLDLAAASAVPASLLLSGPAAGVVGAAAVSAHHGSGRFLSFDMGGTSTDVARIEGGRPQMMSQRVVAGLHCSMPAIAIHTVGAGGGSIGWIDSGRALRVGPQSAGADPGPASYGKGGEAATVTDAHVLMGTLGVERPLGGEISQSKAAAAQALAWLGARAELSEDDVARGMIEVVEAHMERALRVVSIEQGFESRGSGLVAFGGAAGMHASALARRLEMERVLIPPHAGVFSALGLLLSPPRSDVSRSVMLVAGDSGLDEAVGELMQAAAESHRSSAGKAPHSTEVTIDVRYLGQSHETSVPYRLGAGWTELARDFNAAHQRINGFARDEDPIEVVTVRAAATGDPFLRWGELSPPTPSGPRRIGSRNLAGIGEVEVWWRPALVPGDEVPGPAVIEEPEATTRLGQGERALVLGDGTLQVEW